MSDEEFVARWSRRKQEAKADQAKPVREEAAGADGPMPSGRAGAEQGPPEADLSNLPPIEAIDAATDVTAFLRKGIPQELGRAALRRTWSTDPAIRDFVGLAENAWDFNDPNAMPGFGLLDYSVEQVDALVRRIVGDVVEATENLAKPLAEAAEDAERPAPMEADFAQSSNRTKAFTDSRLFDESAVAESPSNSAASQPVAADDAGGENPLPRRTHGGALPR